MKLEEVLPALRAGKIIKRKSWVSLELNEKLCDLLANDWEIVGELANDWEIVGEECYQDGLKLTTKEIETHKDIFNYIDNNIERINHILKINNERLCDLEVKFSQLNIEERLSKLEKDNNIEENKNPHKCAACNGLAFRTIFRDYPPGYSENIPCVPCDGKGVLWK